MLLSVASHQKKPHSPLLQSTLALFCTLHWEKYILKSYPVEQEKLRICMVFVSEEVPAMTINGDGV